MGRDSKYERSSEILRAFARGESVGDIAARLGIDLLGTFLNLRHSAALFAHRDRGALDQIRWQQYLVLMRIVDQALAAWESSRNGSTEIASGAAKAADSDGKLRVASKTTARRIWNEGGDPKYLRVTMEALAEIKDLFGVGAEAASRSRASAGRRTRIARAYP